MLMQIAQRERYACSQGIVNEWGEKPEGFMLTPVKNSNFGEIEKILNCFSTACYRRFYQAACFVGSA